MVGRFRNCTIKEVDLNLLAILWTCSGSLEGQTGENCLSVILRVVPGFISEEKGSSI